MKFITTLFSVFLVQHEVRIYYRWVYAKWVVKRVLGEILAPQPSSSQEPVLVPLAFSTREGASFKYSLSYPPLSTWLLCVYKAV